MKRKEAVKKNEVKTYTTVRHDSRESFEERKSVFISHAKRVTTEEEAKEFIASVKKEYFDARHNCWAYSLAQSNIARFSDDGEPQGTAGIPILNVIKMSGAVDVAVVVTRYFGGILLGTGGLVRAYTEGAKRAVEAAEIVTYECYDEFSVECSYSDYQKLDYELPRLGAKVDSVDFGAQVSLRGAVKRDLTDELVRRTAEIGAGRIKFTVTGERFDA